MVVTHMKANIKNDMSRYLAQDVEDYIRQSKMDENRTWGTDPEVLAAAHLIGIDIMAYTYIEPGDVRWQRFPASLSLESSKTAESIYLDNSSGYHYNVVLSVDQD